MASPALEADRILARLADDGVEFVVVGMMAGVLQGVPATTWDLDIVHRRTEENVARLLGVLRDLDARARHHPKRIRPDQTHLIGPGHVLLQTRFGDLDCLGAIDGARTFDELVETSHVVDFQERAVRVLDLRELAAIKERAGRPKDLAVLPLIRATIDELERDTVEEDEP